MSSRTRKGRAQDSSNSSSSSSQDPPPPVDGAEVEMGLEAIGSTSTLKEFLHSAPRVEKLQKIWMDVFIIDLRQGDILIDAFCDVLSSINERSWLDFTLDPRTKEGWVSQLFLDLQEINQAWVIPTLEWPQRGRSATPASPATPVVNAHPSQTTMVNTKKLRKEKAIVYGQQILAEIESLSESTRTALNQIIKSELNRTTVTSGAARVSNPAAAASAFLLRKLKNLVDKEDDGNVVATQADKQTQRTLIKISKYVADAVTARFKLQHAIQTRYPFLARSVPDFALYHFNHIDLAEMFDKYLLILGDDASELDISEHMVFRLLPETLERFIIPTMICKKSSSKYQTVMIDSLVDLMSRLHDLKEENRRQTQRRAEYNRGNRGGSKSGKSRSGSRGSSQNKRGSSSGSGQGSAKRAKSSGVSTGQTKDNNTNGANFK